MSSVVGHKIRMIKIRQIICHRAFKKPAKRTDAQFSRQKAGHRALEWKPQRAFVMPKRMLEVFSYVALLCVLREIGDC